MKKLVLGDRVRLDSGEVLTVGVGIPCGAIGRRDTLYSFDESTLRLSGREIDMNTQRQWDRK